MVGEFFQKCILLLECQMKAEKQKIQLLINNFSAHKKVP
jgi:hypothetical protein